VASWLRLSGDVSWLRSSFYTKQQLIKIKRQLRGKTYLSARSAECFGSESERNDTAHGNVWRQLTVLTRRKCCPPGLAVYSTPLSANLTRSFLHKHFHYHILICIPVYLLAASGWGRRCRSNFILSLLSEHKRIFHEAQIQLRSFQSCSLKKEIHDMKLIGSCCSCVAWSLVSLYLYFVFRCVLVLVLRISSSSCTHIACLVVFLYSYCVLHRVLLLILRVSLCSYTHIAYSIEFLYSYCVFRCVLILVLRIASSSCTHIACLVVFLYSYCVLHRVLVLILRV
jgi:hypothetical protein